MSSNRYARLGLALAGGLLHAAAFPPVGWWPLVFVGPVLLLRALRGASKREGALAGLAWGLTGLALPGRWCVTVALARGDGLPAALLALAVLVAAPAAFGWLHALAGLRHRRPELLACFAWVATEWLRGRIPLTPCSWFTFAHALGDGAARPLCLAASIAGQAGLSALVMASAVLADDALANAWRRPGRAVAHLVLGAGIPVIVWELGFYTLISAVPSEAAPWTAFQTLIVQEDGPPGAMILRTAQGLERAHRDLTPHVQVLLWPGSAWPRDPYASPELERELRFVAQAFERAVIMGCVRPVEGRPTRSVVAIAPSGREIAERREGDAPWVIPCGYETLGVLFGTESATEEPCRTLVAKGATILVICADDPPEWPVAARLQHALHASLRAYEFRRPVMRAAPRGPSFGLDWIGRPYRTIPHGVPGTTVARVGGDDGFTFYARVGRFAPHLATVVTLVWLALLVNQGARRRSSDAAAAASL